MNFQQQPHTLLMIRPKSFGFNTQTADSNFFQTNISSNLDTAIDEFDKMVDVLKANEISVEVFDDTAEPRKPDAIFPNNWISFHHDGSVVVYPMLAENRRLERRHDIISALSKEFVLNEIIDFSYEETRAKFLEGTGSMVFDHGNRVAFACRSPRTNEKLFNEVCSKLGYKPIIFDALDEKGNSIYHTNVMMSVAEKFCVVCLDSIKNDEDQELILRNLMDTNHKVIAISYEQMRAFAGNILEVQNRYGESIVVMSNTAFNSLLPGQLNAITQFSEVLPVAIPTIERVGGGGVRCMIAGIHLPERK
jgi:hypothetical protein